MKLLLLLSTRRRAVLSVVTLVYVSCGASGSVYGASPSVAPRADVWVPDGPVNAIVESGGVIYLGGNFNFLRPNRGTGISLNLASLQPDLAFPFVNGDVASVAPDGAGGFYIGGEFTRVGGVARTNLAYIGRDRSVRPWNPGANGRVTALVIGDGVVFAGGSFTVIGGQARSRIAALNLATGAATAWNPIANSSVAQLVLSDDTLYLAGAFTSLGGQARTNLAAVDAYTGTVLPWNPSPPANTVRALAASCDTVFVGGTFNTIAGRSRNRLAALDVNTGAATAWNGGSNSTITSVDALAVLGDTLYVGGQFLTLGGRSRNSLGALDAVSGSATLWDPRLTNSGITTVARLAVAENSVFIAGSFAAVSGQARNGFAAVDPMTGNPQSWAIEHSGAVQALAISGRTVYAAGAVLNTGGVPRRNVAALDAATGQPTAWDPNVNGEVFSLLSVGSTIYLGGSFMTVGGIGRTNLAAVNRTNGAIQSFFASNPNGAVYALAAAANAPFRLFVGGSFTSLGGQLRNRLAALDSAGAITGWNPNANGTAYALVWTPGTVFAGGLFTTNGGTGRNRIAALSESTGLASAWNPNANSSVLSLAVSGTTVYVGGTFTNIGGVLRNCLAAFNVTGGVTAWSPNANGAVRALALEGGSLYAGGDFSSIGGQTRQGLAALNPTGSSALAWDPALRAGSTINALVATGNAVHAGGAFDNSGDQFRANFAAFAPEGTPAVTTQPAHQSLGLGQTFTSSISVSGQGPFIYQWRRNGVDLPGQRQATLAIAGVSLADAGAYSVIVSGPLGRVQSDDVILVVHTPPRITAQPVSRTVAPGTNVTFSVTATGSPAPEYYWRRNGSVIPGAIYPTLTLTNVQPTDGGRYSVIVINPVGYDISADAVLLVTSPVLPFTNTLSRRVTLGLGSGVRSGRNVGATNESGEPNHAGKTGGKSVWMGWRAPQSGMATFSTLGSDFDTLLGVYTGPNVSNLTEVASDDDTGGVWTSEASFIAISGTEYLVAVDGRLGESGNIVLSWRLDPPVALPKILAQPVSQVVTQGGTATLKVATTAGIPLTYQWFRGCRSISGETGSNLVIGNVQRRHVGQYSVAIRSSGGQTIRSQPAAVDLGSSAAFGWTTKWQDLIDPGDGTSAGAGAPIFALPAGSFASASGAPAPVLPPTTGTNATYVLSIDLTGAVSQYGDDVACFNVLTNTRKALLTNSLVLPGFYSLTATGAVIKVREGTNLSSFIELNPEACAVSTDASDPVQVEFSGELGKHYTVWAGRLGSTAGKVDVSVVFCTAPVMLSSSVTFVAEPGGSQSMILTVEPESSPCPPSFQWLSNGVPVPGAIHSSYTNRFDPTGLGGYSVVMANQAGTVTNFVGGLINLLIKRDEMGGAVTLRAAPTVPSSFVVERTTDFVTWHPYYTNNAGAALEVQADRTLPDVTEPWRFFRVRPP